jgi:hypothetical protein
MTSFVTLRQLEKRRKSAKSSWGGVWKAFFEKNSRKRANLKNKNSSGQKGEK